MSKAGDLLKLIEDSDYNYNILVGIKGIAKDFYTAPFGRQLDDLRKIRDFIANSKVYYVDAKGKATLPAVKQWVKDHKPSEYYAKWKKDTSYSKDDSVQVYYKD